MKLYGLPSNVGYSIIWTFLFLAIQTIPSPLQGFFWYTGVAAYLVPFCFLALLLTIVMKFIAGKYKNFWAVLVNGIFLAILVGGGNYISGILAAIILTLIGGYAVYKKTCFKAIGGIWLSFMVSFLINVVAPGNSVRQEAFVERLGVIRSCILSFYYCLKYIIDEWNHWGIYAWIIVCIFFVAPHAKKIKYYINPILLFIGSFCILSAMFTPVLFAISNTGEGRVHNIIYISYLMIILINVVNLLSWVVNHLRVEVKNMHSTWEFAAIVLGIVFCALIFIKIDTDFLTCTVAVDSLQSGEAQQYAIENRDRTIKLEDNLQLDVLLEAHTVYPELLFVSDITSDPEDWRNRHMSRYYQKDSVMIVENK